MPYSGLDLHNRLSIICRENSTTLSAFLKSIGKSQSAGTYMKQKKNIDMDVVEKAALRFNVSPDWLIGASEVKNPDAAARTYELDMDEASLIDCLRHAAPPVKAAVIRMAESALTQLAVPPTTQTAGPSFLTINDEMIRRVDEEKPTHGNKQVVGTAAAGAPITAVPETDMYASVPIKYMSDDYFIVRAKGDSMIDAGIKDGDFCIFQKDAYQDEGKIMLVQVEGDGEEPDITIKRVYVHGLETELMPENPDYESMFYPTFSVQIMGVFIQAITPDV